MFDNQREQLASYSGLMNIAVKQPTYRELLAIKKEKLLKEAEDIQAILDFYDKNPEMEKLIDAMRRLSL